MQKGVKAKRKNMLTHANQDC